MEFNAKKSRAQKLKCDKNHTKRQRPNVSDGKGKGSQQNSSANIKDKGKSSIPEPSSMVESAHVSRSESDASGSKSEPLTTFHLKRETEDCDKSKAKCFSRRTITSNWNRYETEVDPINPLVECETIGASFEDLVNDSLIGGSHLKLRHEYEWDKDSVVLQSPWYQLNLQQLNQNISSIPFYIRHDLSSQLFTKEEIKHMQDRSKKFGSELINNRILGSLGIRGEVTDSRGIEPVQRNAKGRQPVHCNEHLPESQPHTILLSTPCNVVGPRENNKNIAGPEGIEDRELDILLALEKSSSSLSDNTTTKSHLENDGLKHLTLLEDKQVGEIAQHATQTSTMAEVEEKDQHVLLSPDKSHTSLNPDGNCKTPTATEKSNTGSLDDWLDSILDD